MTKIARLTNATIGILLCLKISYVSSDIPTLLISGLFLPIFFLYGVMAFKQEDK